VPSSASSASRLDGTGLRSPERNSVQDAAGRALGPSLVEFLPRYDHAHYRACAERVGAILPNLETPERELVGRGKKSIGAD